MDNKRPPSKQPLPKDAKKVFSGEIFSFYQWEQEMFNGEKAIFEKLKRPDTVSVIPVMHDKKIVVSEQEQPGMLPFVSVLGGRVDEGEDPLAAAKRELLEEAGLEAEEYVLFSATQPLAKIDWAVYTFIAKGCRKVQEPHLDAGEKIKLCIVTFDEFVKIASQENFRDTDIALRFLRAMINPSKFLELKNILGV